MKTTNLMLNNWVKTTDGEIYHVKSITGKELPSPVGTYPYMEEDIRGIKLTAKLLEKNGFTRFGEEEPVFVIGYTPWELQVVWVNSVLCFSNIDDNHKRIPIGEAEFVHQLQNFVNLLNIKDCKTDFSKLELD